MKGRRPQSPSATKSNVEVMTLCEERSDRAIGTEEGLSQNKSSQSSWEDVGDKSPVSADLDQILRKGSPTIGFNYKISPDRVTKCCNRKNAKKSRDLDTPSKKTVSLLNSEQMKVSEEIASIHFQPNETSQSNVQGRKDGDARFKENRKGGSPPMGLSERAQDSESLVSSIERDHEKEILWAQRSEYSKEIARIVGMDHPSLPTSYNTMEKSRKKYAGGPVDPNGRCKGRKLVLWHRPRMMEKLLLNIQYECFKAKIRIPWDEIVHRLEPGCSGPSAVQMLNKMRDVLIIEGHMIPPAMGNGIQPDPDIRGYVRDLNAEVPGGTRILRWTESYPNASRSLNDSGFVRGSGNYRKVITRGGAFNKIPRTIEERGHARKVIPEEAYSPTTSRTQSMGKNVAGSYSCYSRRGKPRALWKKPGPKGKSKSTDKSGSIPSPQKSPQLDEELKIHTMTSNLINQTESSIFSRGYCESEAKRDETSSEDTDVGEFSEVRRIDRTSSETWSTAEKDVFGSASGSQLCEAHNGNLTFHSSPLALAEIDSSLPKHFPRLSDALNGQVLDKLRPLDHQVQHTPDYFMETYAANLVGRESNDPSYLGAEDQGILPDFVKALASGSDPRLNGWKYLKLAERLEKIQEHITDRKIDSRINESSVSDKFLDHSVMSNGSVTLNEGFSRHCLNPWPSSEITPDLQNSLIPNVDSISDDYDIKSTQIYDNMTSNTFFPSEATGSTHAFSPELMNCGDDKQDRALGQHSSDKKDFPCFNKNIFNPSGLSHDLVQDCHFSPDNINFEDKVTSTTKSISDTKPPITHNFYSDSENLVEDNFHMSAWQNEFLTEQQDELSQVFKSQSG